MGDESRNIKRRSMQRGRQFELKEKDKENQRENDSVDNHWPPQNDPRCMPKILKVRQAKTMAPVTPNAHLMTPNNESPRILEKPKKNMADIIGESVDNSVPNEEKEEKLFQHFQTFDAQKNS